MANASYNVSLSPSEHKFCQYNTVVMGIFVLTDTLGFFVGQPLFAKLLWINCTSKRLTDILNFNLAVFHYFLYLLSLAHLVLFFAFEEHGKFFNIIIVCAQVGGPMSLTFICLERYVAVILPTSYPLLKTYRCRELCSATVWLVSFATAFLVCLPFQDLSAGVKSILALIPLVVMSIMMDIMVVCTFHISNALKKSGPGQDKLHPVKRRAFVTVCATTSITMFFYIPVTVLHRFDDEKFPFYCLFRALNMLLLTAAGVVHPMFYLHTQGKLFQSGRRKKKV